MKEKNLPVVIIVGRVNAGKSSLFNRLIRKPLAVVDKVPGVTRDSLMKPASWQGRVFQLVDTGGLFPEEEDLLWPEVRRHIEKAVDEADLILFLVDLKVGLTPFDKELALWLRKKGKPVVLAANKADLKDKEHQVFQSLGYGEPVLISATHGTGIGALMENIFLKLEEIGKPAPEGMITKEEKIRVSILGRPNVGKSSLLNALIGKDRVVTSEIPGTTRDSVDVETEEFIFVDTAGLRRKYPDDLAYYSSLRSMRSLRFADVSIVTIDLTEPITKMDKKIINLVEREGRGMVIALNKVDLISSRDRKFIFPEVSAELHFVDYVPKVLTSTVTGEGIPYLMEMVRKTHAEGARRLTREDLEAFLGELVNVAHPPSPIILFEQRGVKPPTFLLVSKGEIGDSYLRFLAKRIRARFGFTGQPIRIRTEVKKRKKDKGRS